MSKKNEELLAIERIKLREQPEPKYIVGLDETIPATGYRVKLSGKGWLDHWVNEFADCVYEDVPNCFYGEQDDPEIRDLYVSPENGGFNAIEINNEIYCLYGWNGEEYLDCWKADEYLEHVHACVWDKDDKTAYNIRPVCVDVYDDEEEFIIIDYKISEN